MTRKGIIISCAVIFLLAFGVRLLGWHDNRFEAMRVEWMVTSDYKTSTEQLLNGDLESFLGEPSLAGHPPGYPLVLALIFKVFGRSDAAIQFVQITFDAIAAVFVFLIMAELLAKGGAITAGLLVALSPQFAYYPLLLLPDSLTVLPLLVAIYCLVLARKGHSLLMLTAAGVFVGISCWLRANALLLAPFMAAIIPVLFERGRRLRYAAAIVAGSIVIIAPITIKNYIVFKRFIPVSLGAGQKLLEGIAEYDETNRFGIPKTDLGIMRQEAVMYGHPDYANLLFGPDAVERDRLRLARGMAVLRSHPFWYAGVMLRRATTFFRLARVPIVSANPPVTHSLDVAEQTTPAWSNTPDEFLAKGQVASAQAKVGMDPGGQFLQVTGDSTKYGKQLASETISVNPKTDYLFRVPVKIREGRLIISIEDASQNSELASAIVDVEEGKSPDEQQVRMVKIPFVSGSSSGIRINFNNGGAAGPVMLDMQMGKAELFELGPTSFIWTKLPRFLIRVVQQFFITAWMIPLAFIGAALIIRSRKLDILAILLVVPLYYLCVQSVFHTERRYVVALHYFLTALAGVAIFFVIALLQQVISALRQRGRGGSA